MIDVSTRVRRAIALRDLLLVRRILKNHPLYIRNPDDADNGNTSLHLAAREGLVDIVEFLVDAGHEEFGVSRNVSRDTPLMLACAGGHEEVVRLLVTRFPACVEMKNEKGVDALIQAIISSHPSLLPFLLLPASAAGAGADPNSADADGTTALHYAAAYGELKSLTLLLQHGADPTRKNAFQWTPVAYSATQASEAYFKSLVGPAATVAGGGDVGGVGLGQRTGKVGQQGGGIRLVSESEKGEEVTEGFGVGDARPSRAWMGLERPGTPTERPGTPSEGRKFWGVRPGTPRGRAGSGE